MVRVRSIPVQTDTNLPDDVRQAKAEATTRFRELMDANFNPNAPNAEAKLRQGEFFKFYEGKELEEGHAGIGGVQIFLTRAAEGGTVVIPTPPSQLP